MTLGTMIIYQLRFTNEPKIVWLNDNLSVKGLFGKIANTESVHLVAEMTIESIITKDKHEGILGRIHNTWS